MEKYIGKYRVVCEFCRATLQPIKEDVYIQCSKNGQIYRVSDNILAYYKPSRGNSKQFVWKLENLGVKDCVDRSSSEDVLIYFNEENLDIVAEQVGVIESGASINPTSVKNLRKQEWFKKNKQSYIDKGIYKELSEEEKEVFRERLKNNFNK